MLTLTSSIDLDTFKNNYWLKLDLITFCKANGLSSQGSKEELTRRIVAFISTGYKVKSVTNKVEAKRDSHQLITHETLVVNYKNDKVTRLFFVKQIGDHFRFNDYLRQYIHKANITSGLTYGDLVDGWLTSEKEKNTPYYQSNIGKQFEYNQFIRDFFANETGKSRSDAIQAWKKIKSISGENTYLHYKSIYTKIS